MLEVLNTKFPSINNVDHVIHSLETLSCCRLYFASLKNRKYPIHLFARYKNQENMDITDPSAGK